MVKKGGTIVLHGCTHQYRGQTTIDYEFWDGLNDQPLFEDADEYVEDRLDKALHECFRNNLYPVAWETPHYAASQLDYDVINRHFSTVYERRQTMNVLGSDQLLPFYIRIDHFFQMAGQRPGVFGGRQHRDHRGGTLPESLAVLDGRADFFTP